MNIFVGNLSGQTTEKQLEHLFTPFGEIKSVKIVVDGYTQRSRGFGFVEMPERPHAEKAIEQLNNTSFQGQSLTVNEARAKGTGDDLGKRRF